MIELFDHITLDEAAGVRRTSDGYLTAMPRVARTGVQIYGGVECGRPEMERVRVYRPADQVFSTAAMNSYAHRPMTNDHPPEAVNVTNWRKYSVGQTGGEVVRDGSFVRVPMVMMDADVIRDFDAGKRELSMGYVCDLAWQSGVTEDGEVFDAIQRNIKANHLAVVDKARGGSALRVGDGADDATVFADPGLREDRKKRYPIDTADHIRLAWSHLSDREQAKHYTADHLAGVRGAIREAWIRKIGGEPPSVQTGDTLMTDKTLVVDGFTISLNDTAAQVVARLMDTTSKQIAALTTQVDEWKKKAEEEEKKAKDSAAVTATTIANKDAEIATLTTKLKDAEVTPEKLEAMATDRATLLTKAKTILGDKLNPKASSNDIRRAAVLAHVGDAAKDFDDNQMVAAFAAIKVDGASSTSPIIDAFRSTAHTEQFGDAQAKADKAYAEYVQSLQNGWQQPATQQ